MKINPKNLGQAAASRGIPWVHLGRDLLLFGQGRFQRRTVRGFTDRTSYISFVISSDKALTNRMLGDVGLPVPRHRVVASEQEAVRAAQQIGYPVAVKPRNADFGLGISLNSPLKKAPLTGVHPTAKHTAAKAISPSSETMRTI